MTGKVFLVGLVIMILGLGIAYLRAAMTHALLATIALWVGIVTFVIGLVITVAPIIVWLDAQIRAMISG